MPLVHITIANRIGTITLDHPKKLNSIGEDLVAELVVALDELERSGVYVIVLRAVPGVKVWSAGHDVYELPAGRRDPLGYQDPLARILQRIQDCPVPIIAMVEGTVWGGGCDVCISCDLIICSDHSTFAITPAKIGLPYNAAGLVRFLNVLGPHIAKEMFFTARPLTAQEVMNARMVNHVVPTDELESRTHEIATAIAANAPMAVRVLKQQFRHLLQGQMLSTESFENIQGMRRVVYDSDDYQEGIKAFKEKRPPQFKGH
ncbi:MAG: methylmalonyl-CoA decarboxylase [Herpetosiphon sp.]